MPPLYAYALINFSLFLSLSSAADNSLIDGSWCHYRDVDSSGEIVYPSGNEYIFKEDGSYTFNGNGEGTGRYLYKYSNGNLEVKFLGSWMSQNLTLENDEMAWESVKYSGFVMHFKRGKCK